MKKTIMLDRHETCCFTGHRPSKLMLSDIDIFKLSEEVERKIIELINNSITNFISGMAIGFDLICAEIVIRYKTKYPQVKLIAAVPCSGQESKWSAIEKQRYNDCIKKADYVITLSESYTPSCMQNRNQYMVDNSCVVVAFYRDLLGGTRNTVEYAKRKNTKIIYV